MENTLKKKILNGEQFADMLCCEDDSSAAHSEMGSE